MLNLLRKAVHSYFTLDERGRHRSPVPYGVRVAATLTEGRTLALVLTFRAGRRYCCTAPQCSFPQSWRRLRDRLREAGVAVGYPMTILLRAVYERGALIAADPGAGEPTYEPVEVGWVSEYRLDEAEDLLGDGGHER